MRVLIVEDEQRLAETLAQLFKDSRWLADTVYDGEAGLDWAMSGIYDVVVLDVMLPKLDGFEVARRLRAEKIGTPILMLTARAGVPDRVAGLDSGADDYMAKPFSPEELLARVRALARRRGDTVAEELSFGDLRLGLASFELGSGDKALRLGLREFEVMRLLMGGAGLVVPKEELIVKVWGADSDAGDNNVEAYISFLRKKLFYLGSKVAISTVRKVGYRLEAGDNA